MVIQLTPEAEATIRELIERGEYGDPGAVVEDALRVLAERNQYDCLKAAIAVGMEQLERGEAVEWTPDFLDRLKRRSEEHVRLGKPFKDEVIP